MLIAVAVVFTVFLIKTLMFVSSIPKGEIKDIYDRYFTELDYKREERRKNKGRNFTF